MTQFLAAAIQLCAGTDKGANLDKAEAMVATAAERGAALIALPEVFAWRGERGDELSGAEAVPGPTTERCARWARTHRVHLLAGSVIERVTGEPKAYNTSLLFEPGGEIIGRYRKAHLFDVALPGRLEIRESASRMSGTEVVTARTALGVVGMAVCYDLRFPELFRAMTLSGAQIVCLPSAFTFPTGAAHWEPLVRARAIENQVYVIAANQIGPTPLQTVDYGNSVVVDPWGTIIARAPDAETVITAPIDLEYESRVRRELPCLTHVKFAR